MEVGGCGPLGALIRIQAAYVVAQVERSEILILRSLQDENRNTIDSVH